MYVAAAATTPHDRNGALKSAHPSIASSTNQFRLACCIAAQVTLAELLDRFPAEQGLGSVVGYVALAARDGELLPGIETITWTGVDGTRRHARVPRLCFLRERSSVPTR